MRPDEQANLADIERDEKFRKNLQRGAASAATLGTGLVASGLTSKILPFLNEYIPADLAVKGISKISPKLGDFLKRGQSMGLKVEEGLQYVKDQIIPKGRPQESRNVIEQYSPELHQFIVEQIRQGRSPLEAGALAQLESKGAKGFKSIIDKITKDHKAPWSAILQSAYGDQQAATQNPGSSAPFEPMNTGSPGNGQQALMAILQKLQQSRGG